MLYLDDNRLHLVAAPGSGKDCTWGLEVIRRIDKPTLVLAHTITIFAIKWVDRLLEFLSFLPGNLARLGYSTDVTIGRPHLQPPGVG